MNHVPLFNHEEVKRNGCGKNGHCKDRAPEAPNEPGAEEVAHVNGIARADIDSFCRCLLCNGFLGKARRVQAIDEEAIGWVGVLPTIDCQVCHKDDIEERVSSERGHSYDELVAFQQTALHDDL